MNTHSNHGGALLLSAAIAIFGAMSLPVNAQQGLVRGLPGTQSGVAAAHSQEARQQREDKHSQEARQQREDKVTAIQPNDVR